MEKNKLSLIDEVSKLHTKFPLVLIKDTFSRTHTNISSYALDFNISNLIVFPKNAPKSCEPRKKLKQRHSGV